MSNYEGVIIEESLDDKIVLKDVEIVSTKVEDVETDHQTPWLKQWTLHTVTVSEGEIETTVEKMSQALETEHDWYADFRNDNTHYIIFHNKVFKVDRSKPEEYEQVVEYGKSLGIPDHQLDFSPHMEEWKR